MRARGGWLARAVMVGIAAGLAGGCHFAGIPAHRPSPRLSARATPPNPQALRLADAPALVVQCAISSGRLRPGRAGWLRGDSVRITPADAAGFEAWWRSHGRVQVRGSPLSAWALWAAAHARLPPPVCGSAVTARQLQQRVYGAATPDPW
jgi:hypothetical protein